MKIDTMEQLKAGVEATIPESLTSSRGTVVVPCTRVLLVERSLVRANTYNPNHVAPDKLELLVRSIADNGFCFPIVTIYDDADGVLVVVDGFHRWLVSGPEWLSLSHVPVVVIASDMTRRMAATVQFNKARGHHQVDLDADIVRALLEQGLTETEVAERLGLDEEAVHRYKQVAGVASVFARTPYSAAWEIVDD